MNCMIYELIRRYFYLGDIMKKKALFLCLLLILASALFAQVQEDIQLKGKLQGMWCSEPVITRHGGDYDKNFNVIPDGYGFSVLIFDGNTIISFTVGKRIISDDFLVKSDPNRNTPLKAVNNSQLASVAKQVNMNLIQYCIDHGQRFGECEVNTPVTYYKGQIYELKFNQQMLIFTELELKGDKLTVRRGYGESETYTKVSEWRP
jgi:hypothetical protein